MRRAVAAVLCSAACSVPAVSPDGGEDDAAVRAWNANEVSLLFPLPLDPARLLPMEAPKPDGGVVVLLPKELFHRLGNPDGGLPRLVEAAGSRDLYPELRVVSARVDPCFDGPSDAGCQRQLRLVAQPFDPLTGRPSDASVHLFFRLGEARFVGTLARLRALSRGTAVSGPLRVHPALAAEGLAGSFSEEVRALIRDACEEGTFTRFTFFATGRSKNWFFFGLDRQADGSFTLSEVKGVGESDAFTDQGSRGFRMGVLAAPVPWFPEALLTTAETRDLSPTAFAEGYDALAKLSNPKLTRTADVSCAACHAAESTQAEALFDRDAGEAPPAPSAYATPRLMPLATPLKLGNMHAFSYFFEAATISERAANETAEVVRYLSSDAFLLTLSDADRDILR